MRSRRSSVRSSPIISKIGQLEAEQRSLGCPIAARMLPVDIPIQQQTNWCWVAVGSGITSFYDQTAYSQCSVVTEVFSAINPPFNVNCCDPAVDASQLPCNGESGADQALDHPRHHFVSDTGQLDWASLVAQIDQGRPVAAEIAWQGGGAHFVAITGYSESADSPPQYSVYVQDPGSGSGSYYSLGQFAKAYDSSGTWVASCLSAQEP